ncbi:MAG TPA: glycosyltransferase family 2 protein [Candidatus Limiplasma sp.]|nr:glycosyltransferase family 2 protein [Candidatus Limiplasma sp.]
MMTAELWFGAIGLVVSRILFRKFPMLPNHQQGGHASGLSVIIPARNEAHNLPNLLTDLAGQTMQSLEILCVNDDSEDDTATVAAAYGATVLQAADRPAGWLGKAWACECGARFAKGEYLLFIDADVRLAPNALAALWAEYSRNQAVISVQPYHSVAGGYEQLALVFNLVQAGANGMCLPRQSAVGLYGPLIWISRAIYDQVGGYASVRSSIVEDVALGSRLLSNGYPLRLLAGGGEVRFRMYRDGLASLVQGWTKNFAAGATKSPLWLTLLVFLWVTGCAAVPLGLFLSLFAAQWSASVLFSLLYLAWVSEMWRVGRKIGGFQPFAFAFYPLSLGLFVWVFLRSTVKRLLKRPVQWKNRSIPWG